MDSNNQNLELLNVAIKRFIEDETINKRSNDDDKLLLSRLLSQLESLKEEQKSLNNQSQTSTEILEEEPCTGFSTEEEEAKTKSHNNVNDSDKEEIVKELKKVERQNSLTHWLLSIMIVLTVSWQISEVSLILKVKDRLTNPLKHIGGLFTNMLKRTKGNNGNGQRDDSDITQVVPPPGPPLHMPELPRLELPDFTVNGKKILGELNNEW